MAIAQLAAIHSDGAAPSTSNAVDDAIFRRPELPKEIEMQEYIELVRFLQLQCHMLLDIPILCIPGGNLQAPA